VDKARSWFLRAVTLDPDIGDIWGHFLKFELQHGSAESQKELVARWVAGWLRPAGWLAG
jgi:pre-mRNA-processing factor 6